MIEEKGPWAAAFGNDKTFIESDDFTHDVRLYVSGDFKSTEHIVEYAEEIAKRLNTYASRDVEVEFAQAMIAGFLDRVDSLEQERDQLREHVTMLRDVVGHVAGMRFSIVTTKMCEAALAKVRKP